MRPGAPSVHFLLLRPKLSMDLNETFLLPCQFLLLGAFVYLGGQRPNTKTGTKEKWHLPCDI